MDGVVTIALLGASVCLPTVVAVCLFSNRVRDLLPGGRGVCVSRRSAAKRSVCRVCWPGATVVARMTTSKEAVACAVSAV